MCESNIAGFLNLLNVNKNYPLEAAYKFGILCWSYFLR